MILRVLLPGLKFWFSLGLGMSPPSSSPEALPEDSTLLRQELTFLADQNERRSLLFCSAIALATAWVLPVGAVLLGVQVVGRSSVFWLFALILEALIVFAVWYGAVLWIAPPRSNSDKLLAAIQFAASNPSCVSMSQGGRQVTIFVPGEQIILTGPEARLFLKYRKGIS